MKFETTFSSHLAEMVEKPFHSFDLGRTPTSLKEYIYIYIWLENKKLT